MTPEIFHRIAELKIIPVVNLDSMEHALPLADALIAGGLPILELTFRTPAAAEAIRLIATQRPELHIGAGTVTSPEQARIAKESGASFAVAPGVNPAVIQAAIEVGLPFAPGVMSPTDIELGMAAGATHFKFFPAEQCGGVPMLKCIAGPYAHLGIKFITTGGINLSNMKDYLACEQVAAVGGSWLTLANDIASENWSVIRDRAEFAVSVVSELR